MSEVGFSGNNARGYGDLQMDTEGVRDELNTKWRDAILKYVNAMGSRPDNIFNMTQLVGEQKYLRFWSNFLDRTQIDVKHQYMRMKFQNDAIVVDDDAANPIIDAIVGLLQRLGRHPVTISQEHSFKVLEYLLNPKP